MFLKEWELFSFGSPLQKRKKEKRVAGVSEKGNQAMGIVSFEIRNESNRKTKRSPKVGSYKSWLFGFHDVQGVSNRYVG